MDGWVLRTWKKNKKVNDGKFEWTMKWSFKEKKNNNNVYVYIRVNETKKFVCLLNFSEIRKSSTSFKENTFFYFLNEIDMNEEIQQEFFVWVKEYKIWKVLIKIEWLIIIFFFWLKRQEFNLRIFFENQQIVEVCGEFLSGL